MDKPPWSPPIEEPSKDANPVKVTTMNRDRVNRDRKNLTTTKRYDMAHGKSKSPRKGDSHDKGRGKNMSHLFLVRALVMALAGVRALRGEDHPKRTYHYNARSAM